MKWNSIVCVTSSSWHCWHTLMCRIFTGRDNPAKSFVDCVTAAGVFRLNKQKLHVFDNRHVSRVSHLQQAVDLPANPTKRSRCYRWPKESIHELYTTNPSDSSHVLRSGTQMCQRVFPTRTVYSLTEHWKRDFTTQSKVTSSRRLMRRPMHSASS